MPPPQIQWPVIGYMKATRMKLNTRKAMNLMRSATAPETIVAAVPANTNWKKNFAQSTVGRPANRAINAAINGGGERIHAS